MKKLISTIASLSLLCNINTGIYIANAADSKASDSAVTVTLDPSDALTFNGGKFEGWGTSLCWWANRTGYSKALTQQAADRFFTEDGLGLDIVRYNLGGGDDPTHNHITRSDSVIPGYWSSYTEKNDGADVDITYDWTKDANQRNIALAALNANPDLYIEGFSNSPPYFMTNSGCSSGAEDASQDNLKPEMYDDFARFIAEATSHLKSEYGIAFKSYSPMNEPDTSYWGALSPKQEGCHFTPGENQSNMIIQTRAALDEAGLSNVLVAGMDETNIDSSVSNLTKLTDEAKAALGRIDTHTYGGSKRAALRSSAQNMGKDLWMSEVDGGWDAFGLATRIITDMNNMKPSAWIMWDIIDRHKDANFVAPDGSTPEANATISDTDSLWGVGLADHDQQELILTNKYYGFGQFTKYINPGDTIISSSTTSLAAYNKESGDIKIVALNNSSTSKNMKYDLSAFTKIGSSVKEIRTNNSNEKWAEITDGCTLLDKTLSTILAPSSITTYVISGNGPVNYALITGCNNTMPLGSSAKLLFKTDVLNAGAATWSVSSPSLASITPDGLLTANASGTFTVYAKSGDITSEITITVPPYTLSGTPSWSNSTTAPSDSADYTQIADGDFATYFDGNQNGWVMYDFATAYKPQSIQLAAREGNGMPARTVGGKIQASNDAITWTDLYKISTEIPADIYTTINSSDLISDKAYRYFRYTNPDNMTNLAEFIINGTPSTNIAANEPLVNDIAELSDDFESDTNIFSAESGDLTAPGNQVFDTTLSRFSRAFAPANSTAKASIESAITLTNSQKLRFNFDMFAGWETGGKENSLKLIDKDGNEIFAMITDSANCVFSKMQVGKTDVLSNINTNSQCRSNMTGRTGANGWDSSDQPYRNNVGFNKHIELIIDGTGAYTLTISGGVAEDSNTSGTLSTPVSLSSLELTGSYKTSVKRTVCYDNFNTDLITYAEPLPTPIPTVTPVTTDPPQMPEDGKLIGLNFDNGDLTSSSSFGKAEGTPLFTTIDGKSCAQFDGTRQTAITLNDANGNSLLTGLDELTIKFKFNPTSTSTSWWFFAAPNADAQTYQKEKYIGIMNNNSSLTVERYNNNGSRSESSTAAIITNSWNDVVISMSNGVTTLYVNDEVVSQTASAVDLSDMLGTSSVAYIGIANWGTGEFATGYIDDFEIYNKATEPKEDYFTAYAENGAIYYTSTDTNETDIYTALKNSNGNLIALNKGSANGVFENIPTGSYTVSRYAWNGMISSKNVSLKTVKIENEIEKSAYLFTHFAGTESNEDCEQIYFSVSQDGSSWTTLNSGLPVLKSTVGELGVRDPHIIRSDDDKYYIIATDLSIYNRRDDSNRWDTCQTSGSKNIVVWESDDLVNWSNANLVKVAPDNAGCTWAPEAIYDSERDMYMVFWASKTSDDNYATQRIYRCFTKDFVTFTNPEIYIDGGSISNIDTTITSYKGFYYRFTKNESKSSITMIKSTSLDGPWSNVTTYTLNSTPGATVTGYEGPTIYKLNGTDSFCLLLDYYSKSQGYKPFVTDDITLGKFASANDFTFDATYRHGTVIPITMDEYNALIEKYSN